METFNPQNCQEHDNILVYNEELQKHQFGKITEFKPNHGSFFYNVYIQSDQIGSKLQNFQKNFGSHELFLTDQLNKEKIENIREKIQILDLPQYVNYLKLPEDQQQLSTYVSRGFYDMSDETLRPDFEMSFECICGIIINPDHSNIVCKNCNEKVYHYNCLNASSACEQCGNSLKKEDYQETVNLKRQRENVPSLDEIPPMKKIQTQNSVNLENEEEDDEEENLQVMKKAQKKEIDGDKIKNLFAELKKKKQAAQQQNSNIQTSKQQPQLLKKSNSITQQNSGNSKPQSMKKQYSNINEEQVQELNKMLERYRKSSSTDRLKDIAKKRQEVKESKELNSKDIRALQSQGLNLQQADAQLQSFKEEFQKIKSYNNQQMFEESRKLAIQIETNLFRFKNSHNSFTLSSEYKERFRLVNSHLLDDNNHILRLKVLLKSMQIQDLITTDEINLYNPQKKKEIDLLKQKEQSQAQVKQQSFTLIKTNKADMEILENNKQKDDDYEKLLKYEEEQEQIKIQNEKRRQELLIKGTPFEYRDYLEVNDNKQFITRLKDSLENINQSQIDHTLFQDIINFTAGNGKKRMQHRIQNDLREEDQYKFLPSLDQF